MPGIENVLPAEMRFDTILSELRNDLMDEYVDRTVQLCDILDPSAEFSRDPAPYWELSRVLANALASADEASGDVRGALYRSFCFAFQVVHDIKPRPIQAISLVRWLEPYEETRLTADMIRAEISDYLGQRPNIDAFIGCFASEIAGAYAHCEHHVEIGAGLIFMLAEQDLAQSEIDAYIESVHPQQIIDKDS